MNQFESSPVIGIGRFRVNDRDLEYRGAEGFLWVATEGERVHNDDEPHNQVLYLLSETGVIGLAAYATPFVLAWRWTRRAADEDGGDEEWRMLSRVSLLYAVIVGLVSSGTMGTGLGLITAVLYFGAGRAYLLGSVEASRESVVEVGHR
jgi:O-antigen ligase